MMFKFGQHVIKKGCVFWESKLSFAFVNIKPVLPGHVLISPKRIEPSFTNLSPEEAVDIFQGAQQLSSLLKSHYNTTSLTLVIQDGVDAGQTVKHVHIHLMPRLPGDFANNDDIYGEIERVDSRKSEVRTEVEMEREAQTYRELAKEMGISSS